MKYPIRFAIGLSTDHFHVRFAEALDGKIKQGLPVEYDVIDLNRHDWLNHIEQFDVIVWKPSLMGPQFAGHFKEKVYFIEKIMGKLVIPNYSSVWHFDSKVAQSCLFEYYKLPAPHTVVSFDYHDALQKIWNSKYPVVLKKSYGAGSHYVRLIKSEKEAKYKLEQIFCQQLWNEAKQINESRVFSILKNLNKRWLWAQIIDRILDRERFGVVYWQEFIPNNPADLRITVIGDSYAFGFWRKNRPDDFRASGSGIIDYNKDIPEDIIRYCLDISKKFDFDSMAYDLLFSSDGFVITEISYGYLDSAIYKANGHYELSEEGKLLYIPGHVWPQYLWIEWALQRLGTVTK